MDFVCKIKIYRFIKDEKKLLILKRVSLVIYFSFSNIILMEIDPCGFGFYMSLFKVK